MKKIVLAGVIAVAFAAAPAFAQGYVGVGVGSSAVTGVDQAVGTVTLTGGNSSKTSLKIFGGFQFTPNWAVEVQYSDLGKRDLVMRNGAAQVGSGNLNASQFGVAAVGILPLASNFSLFGKLGVSGNSSKVNLSVPAAGFAAGASENKTDLMIGVGLTYAITPSIAVRAEYEDFGKLSSGSGGSIRANNFSVGLQYKF
jgi:OmpA-OmpF porin, OOP family